MERNNINVGIVGMGVYIPDRVVTNDEIGEIIGSNDEWIKSRTGIAERRFAAPHQATSDMGVIAGRRALEDAGISPEEVDLIILATATPDMFFPASACLVQDRLGAKKAAAFDLEAGCTGFVYALVTGSQFISSGLYKTVLIIGSDTLSRITNWQDPKTCVLLGDAAGAVVLTAVPKEYGLLAVTLGSDGSGGMLLTIPAGGSRMPTTPKTVERNLHTLDMNGREVFKFAVRIMVESTEEVVQQAGLSLNDISLFIPHQANSRIIEAAAKKLNVPMDRMLVNINRYGNTSSASIPLALWEGHQEGRFKHGDNIVMVGFGSGLTWGAVVLRWYQL